MGNYKLIEKKCLGCGVEFEGHKLRKFCAISCASRHNGYSKGAVPWNKGNGGYSTSKKGFKHSDEFRRKVSSTRIKLFADNKLTVWNKGLKGYCAGPQHYNWKGGSAHGERVRFRDQMQHRIFARDSYTCQVCLKEGGYLQVDHIKPWAQFPELRFDMDNCRTLCMACHYFVTFKRKIPEGVIWGHGLSRGIAK